MDKWTHYQVFLSFDEDDEREVGKPFKSLEDAVAFASTQKHPYWLVYPCRQVQGPNSSWWLHASSYRTISW